MYILISTLEIFSRSQNLVQFFPIRRLPVERCLYLSTNLNLGTFCWSEVTINLHFCLLIEESPSSNSCEKLVQTSSKCDPLSQLLDQFLSKTFYVGITGISNKYFHIWISQKQNNLTDGPPHLIAGNQGHWRVNTTPLAELKCETP